MSSLGLKLPKGFDRADALSRFHNSYIINYNKLYHTMPCWEWKKTRKRRKARPETWFRVGGIWRSAYQWSYVLFVRAIKPGLTIDHLCCNPRCVNPDHLEQVTHQVNQIRNTKYQKAHKKIRYTNFINLTYIMSEVIYYKKVDLEMIGI